MLIKIATKVLNELNYIDTFIDHYFKIGVNEIHFFDSGSGDGTVEKIKDWSSNKKVKLILSDKTLRHTSYSRETEVCNYVLQHALDDTAQSNKACWWLFPDIDEFLRTPQNGLQSVLEKANMDFIRAIFFDWYFPPEIATNNFTIPAILKMIEDKMLKGRLLNLWEDPFYKDFIMYIHPENVSNYKASFLRTIAGNHRYLLKDEVIIPNNEPYLIFDHLRGASLEAINERLNNRLQLLMEQHQKKMDDWTFEHFSKIKSELEDYNSFYLQSLHSYDELEAMHKSISQYDNSSSFYNKIIY